jgi:hypothetical protein
VDASVRRGTGWRGSNPGIPTTTEPQLAGAPSHCGHTAPLRRSARQLASWRQMPKLEATRLAREGGGMRPRRLAMLDRSGGDG